MQDDLDVWIQFLRSFNGVSFWRTDLRLEAELQIHSDASGAMGFGVYFRGHWCAEPWPHKWVVSGVCTDLTFLELFPILVVVWLWGDHMANHSVHFWRDNLVVVYVLNSLNSRSHRVMVLVRAFTLRCLRLNILFWARHIPGLRNEVADALSHKQMVALAAYLAQWGEGAGFLFLHQDMTPPYET